MNRKIDRLQDVVGSRGMPAPRSCPKNAALPEQKPFCRTRILRYFICAGLSLVCKISTASTQTPVLTRSYDNGRTGANTSETSLAPSKVLAQGLTKIFTLRLVGDDPRIEAQPLYVPGITMSDNKKHDVLYAFSMSNNVWAFDANSGAPVWPHPVSLGPAFLPKKDDPVDSKNINKSFGILSTPVIDLDSGTIYIVNWLSDQQTHQSRAFRLNAIRLSDGQPQAGKAALPIQASITNQAGQELSLNQVQKQRAALLLVPLKGKAPPAAHKILYVAFTGAESPPQHGDPTKANHGWVVAFDVDDWKQTAAWISTPSSFGGGIWQASQGLAADEHGDVYFMTANGGYIEQPGKKDFNGLTDFAESFIKLSYSVGQHGPVLTLVDWFAPFRDVERKDWQDSEVTPFKGYDYTDQDLGSGGPILPPGTGLVLGAGKDGVLYVLDKNKMGKVVGDMSKLKVPPSFFTFDPDGSIPAYAHASPDGNLDFKPMQGVKTHHLHGSPVYWSSSQHGPMLFAWGENGALRAFSLDASGKTKLLAHGKELASAKLADPNNPSLGGMPGAMLALSANGGADGVLWATAPVDEDANKDAYPGVVRAYDASNFAGTNSDGTPQLRKLWESAGFTYSKFCTPIVADGKLFVPTYDGKIDVYALSAQHP